MSQRNMSQILLRLYRPQAGGTRPASPELDAQVMAAYGKRFGGRRRFWWTPGSMLARSALACILVIALVGVACEMPTSTQVDMGQRIVVVVQASDANADVQAFENRLQQALRQAGAEQVRIVVGRTDDRHLMMDIVAWDEDLSPMDVETILRDEIGAADLLTVQVTTLSGTVSETVGRRLMRQFFGLDVSRDSAEEIRAGILQQLADQGFDGKADVEVLDDGSTRTINVEAGTADGAREIADEIVIERQDP